MPKKREDKEECSTGEKAKEIDTHLDKPLWSPMPRTLLYIKLHESDQQGTPQCATLYTITQCP